LEGDDSLSSALSPSQQISRSLVGITEVPDFLSSIAVDFAVIVTLTRAMLLTDAIVSVAAFGGIAGDAGVVASATVALLDSAFVFATWGDCFVLDDTTASVCPLAAGALVLVVPALLIVALAGF